MISKSSTLQIWLAVCASAALLICTPSWAKRPNIVLMLADDWGFSDVGAFGGEIQTPNLNQLAQSGMRFSNFHVSASCSPTRSMLLTGVDNHLNG
ncbi:MAG: sulfatase-like hydrolase/transferase, partial [Limnohabitans sp.]